MIHQLGFCWCGTAHPTLADSREAERDRIRAILTDKLHPRTDGYGVHPNFIDEIVDEIAPPTQKKRGGA